jgi:Domain of unknown function (DUF4112)
MDRSIRPDLRPAAGTSPADLEALAWLLDNSIPIPGTGRRIGLDAIIGLVPWLGDLVSGGLGLVVVARAAQLGLPPIVLARMLANVAIDFAIGAIPFLGDAFDLWFKSNARNIGLVRRYTVEPGSSTAAQWAFFAAIALGLLLMVIGVVWLVGAFFGALFG